MEEKDKSILFELGPEIRDGLNVPSILPHLIRHQLTTTEERESLLNPSTTSIEKKNNLIFLWLPHKGNNSLSRFIEALKDSANEEPTHGTLAYKIQAKRTEVMYTKDYSSNADGDHTRSDSGVEATGHHYPQSDEPSIQNNTSHSTSRPTLSDTYDTGEWESLTTGSDFEEDNLQDSLQKQYSKVMGPKGVAKIADKIPVGEFRLFCFNITRTAEDYSRMGSECSQSNDVWCRISMNCNLCYFAPLESICQHFSKNHNGDELKMINDYKKTLSNKVYEPILHKTKPYEGYQSINEPKELFASCIVNIAISLDERIADKKIRLEDMKSYFCTLQIDSVDYDHKQETLITNRNMRDNITKAKDVFFLLFAISPCWDYVNFLFLEEHVVKQFGGDEEKRELRSYKHYLKNRWFVRPVREYPDMSHELTCFKDYNQVKCRVNADWDTTKTAQVVMLTKVVASVYNVNPSIVKLFKANKGSVILHFTLPSSCIRELSDEKILLLAKHNFLELTVYDKAGEINSTVSYNITEKFTALDDSFQAPESSDNELCSKVLLAEKIIKDSALVLSHDNQPKKPFKHQASYYIVLQTLTPSSKLNIYHIASSHTGKEGLIDSRTLYGIDVRMKSDKGKLCTLEVTQQNSILTILFSTQAEAQQWFIALKRIIGCFHLHLKISPPNLHIPEDLVVQVDGDPMTFWSVVNDTVCMEWRLSDLKSVFLKNALYICVNSLSNALLKEDVYVFEGQQLEKLYDLLEEYKSALSSNPDLENNLTSSYIEQEDGRDKRDPAHYIHKSPCKVPKSDKRLKRTFSSVSTLSSEESGSLSNFSDYDILSEIFSAESTSTTYHAFSWKIKEEIQLQDKSIQLIKTSWYDIVSKYILNRGYRIIVTIPEQQPRILAQEKNNKEGKKQIYNRWKTIVQAVNEAYITFKQPPCTKEIGHFQTASVVVQTSEVYDLTMPHFQNVYYGTMKPSKKVQTGMAQCTIPPAQLKEMYSNLSKNKFWLKLWPSSTSNSSINVNYLNETECHQFKETLDEPTTHSTNSEILLYIPRSSKSFEENLIQTSQLAVDLGFSGKVAVFDWCPENYASDVDHTAEEVAPQLLQFIRMLHFHSSKVHIVAVYDAALLVMKLMSLELEFTLGQVIFTRLANHSSCVFKSLQYWANKNEQFSDNLTIYHLPKSCSNTFLPIRSITFGSANEVFSKKTMAEPPPFITNADIICLGSHPRRSSMKIREYAVNKIVIEDMSEIICFGRRITDRSSRIKLQCGCRELKTPIIYSSRPTCTLCNCPCYFVLGSVIGLGNFTPSLLEEVQQSLLQRQEKTTGKIVKCLSVSSPTRTRIRT